MKNILQILVLIIFLTNIAYSQSVNVQKFQLGISYEERGEYESAQRIYEALIKDEPNNTDFFNAYARIMKQQNKFSELLVIVTEKIKKKETVEMLDLYAELNWRAGNTEIANKSWEQAVDIGSMKYETYQKIAQTQLNMRLFDKAINTFLNGRVALKGDVLFADELSRLYISIGKYTAGTEEILKLLYQNMNLATAQGRIYALMTNEEAKKYLETRLADESNTKDKNLLSQELYAWYLRTINKLENALDVYIRLDELKRANGLEIMNFSNISIIDGQYDIAIKALQIVIDKGKKNPYNASAVFGLTRAMELKTTSNKLMSNEEATEIIKFYGKIVDDYPNTKYSADARYRISMLYFKNLKNIDKAKNELNQLLKEFPRMDVSGSAGLLLADIYLTENNLAKAKEFYKVVLEKNQSALPADKESALFMIAEIDFYEGKIDSSRESYVKIVQNSNSDVANDAFKRISIIDAGKQFVQGLQLFSQAELMKFQSKFNEAIDLYMKTSESSKGSALSETALFTVADIYFNQKNHLKTKEVIDELFKENPETGFGDDALMLLGDSYTENKQIEEAIKTYSDILLRYPNSVLLQSARKKIRLLRNEKI